MEKEILMAICVKTILGIDLLLLSNKTLMLTYVNCLNGEEVVRL